MTGPYAALNKMIKSKKAAGLSMNMIVVAVIALIVLVVIVVIFSGKVGEVSEKTGEVSEEYSGQKCNVPGTSRDCRSMQECEDRGGTSFGTLDCQSGICCSK